jgi:hypothetical protein
MSPLHTSGDSIVGLQKLFSVKLLDLTGCKSTAKREAKEELVK